MPVSSAQKEANRKKNLAEARALLQSGKKFDDLASHHQTAIKRTMKKSGTSFEDKYQSEDKDAPNLSKQLDSYTPAFGKGEGSSKVSKKLSEYGSTMGAQSRSLVTNPRAINEDNTHHSQMGTIGDYLSEKLDEAHDSGSVLSAHAQHIDNQLAIGHQHLAKSNSAHDRGDVPAARRHMEEAGNAYYGAAVQMRSKNIQVKSTVGKIAKDVSNAYVNSKMPGIGSAPHENFTSMKRVSTSPVESKRADTTIPKASKKDISALSKSFEQDRPDIDTSYIGREHEFTGSEILGNHIRNYMDGR
jgi:hypothetical protein